MGEDKTEVQVDGRKLRYQHRRQELLEAAMEYVLDHGVHGLTLRPLAQGIGVTIATLIRHFESKERLIEEIGMSFHNTQLLALNDSDLQGLAPAEAMRILWHRWSDPQSRRGFAMLFELYGLAVRDPDSYRWFLDSIVRDWLAPIERALMEIGRDEQAATTQATVLLALIRGLHLDIAATGDLERVGRAFELVIAMYEMPGTP